MGHLHDESLPWERVYVFADMGDTSLMNDTTQNVNVGLAGSLTMVFLTLAVTLLCVSFYRRYKRAQRRQEDLAE